MKELTVREQTIKFALEMPEEILKKTINEWKSLIDKDEEAALWKEKGTYNYNTNILILLLLVI